MSRIHKITNLKDTVNIVQIQIDHSIFTSLNGLI